MKHLFEIFRNIVFVENGIFKKEILKIQQRPDKPGY
jgi:hypothetical protein